MEAITQNGKKTLWQKEKLHVTSKFSFSHSVLMDLYCTVQTHKSGLVWDWVNLLQATQVFDNSMGKA